MPSDLDRAIAQARRALLARESTATTALLDAWGLVWEVLARELAALTAEIAAARAAGEDVGIGTLYRSARYQSLMAQLADEVTRYSVSAEQRIAAAQRVAATAGWADAGSFIGAQGATLAGSFDVLPADALRELVGVMGDGSPLSSLLAQLGPQAAEATRAALVTGVALGSSPRAIASAVQRATSILPSRALTLSRTESLRAYRSASLRRFRDGGLVESWLWSAQKGPRTCPVCIAKDGTIHPVDEDFASHPNCFPAGTIVSGPRAVGPTIRWYAGDLVELVTASGNFVAVTPNHPILTPDGWVAAGLLEEGGHVISRATGELPLAAVNPDEYQAPSLIEDVAHAVGGAEGVVSGAVPTAPEDFHGDGEGSQVHIVRADRTLRDAGNPQRVKPALQQGLVGRDVVLPRLVGPRAAALLFKGLGALARGLVGCLGVPAMIVGRARFHHEPVGFRDTPNRDTGTAQTGTNDHAGRGVVACQRVLRLAGKVAGDDLVKRQSRPVPHGRRHLRMSEGIAGGLVPPHAALDQDLSQTPPGDVVSLRDSLATFAGDVCRDRLINVRIRRFAGHVYNLQTQTGWYIANGIIAHNCRCVPVPIVASSDALDGYQSGSDWFAALDEDMQREILGPGKFDLYAAGDVTLDDLVAETYSARWGPGLRERSLAELAARGEALAAD
jgi:SPP1 gp7 family putative phage head morphogenesis protein